MAGSPNQPAPRSRWRGTLPWLVIGVLVIGFILWNGGGKSSSSKTDGANAGKVEGKTAEPARHLGRCFDDADFILIVAQSSGGTAVGRFYVSRAHYDAAKLGDQYTLQAGEHAADPHGCP
jgi:hypothetical protein